MTRRICADCREVPSNSKHPFSDEPVILFWVTVRIRSSRMYKSNIRNYALI